KKGDMDYYIEGLQRLKNVPPNAKILILESCTHHKKEDDIGTVKIPNLFRKKIRSDVTFDFAHGLDRDIESLQDYHLIITCGACMITRSVMMAQISVLREHKIPITNYGLFLAYTNGLLPRALECLPEYHQKYMDVMR
ncbi:MAG: [Spirochaetales bacterium]|nr:[FeFe] hydrogenase H-cluster maturation GTPase HydF [Spirochaetales bacterium]